MVKSLLIAGFGGFVGTALRFLITRYIQVSYISVFPWGTFTVNILGSFLIGIFLGISEKGNFMSPEWRIFLTVGVCGGFTTFSSLSNDAFILLQNRDWIRFAVLPCFQFFSGLTCCFHWSFTHQIHLIWKRTQRQHYCEFLLVPPIKQIADRFYTNRSFLKQRKLVWQEQPF